MQQMRLLPGRRPLRSLHLDQLEAGSHGPGRRSGPREGGLDEISTFGKTAISEIKDGAISSYEFHHSAVGIPSGALTEIAGGDAELNARIIREILDGKKNSRRNITVLNAGAAIYISGKTLTFLDGIKLAEESIDSQKAKKKLQELVDSTN